MCRFQGCLLWYFLEFFPYYSVYFSIYYLMTRISRIKGGSVLQFFNFCRCRNFFSSQKIPVYFVMNNLPVPASLSLISSFGAPRYLNFMTCSIAFPSSRILCYLSSLPIIVAFIFAVFIIILIFLSSLHNIFILNYNSLTFCKIISAFQINLIFSPFSFFNIRCFCNFFIFDCII